MVSLVDFDPESIRWPESWGAPLSLDKSMAIVVLRDDGGERAFGHYLAQPERRGFFLKHLTAVMEAASAQKPKPDCPRVASEFSTGSVQEAGKKANREPSPLPLAPSLSALSALSTRASESPTSPKALSESSSKSPPSPEKQLPGSDTRAKARLPGSPSPSPSRAHTSDQAPLLQSPTSRQSQTPARTERVDVDHSSYSSSDQVSSRQGVRKAAELIGLDLERDEGLCWLAESAAGAELPAGWAMFHDDAGRAAYYHEQKKLVVRKHPMLDRYRCYVARLRAFYHRAPETQALNGGRRIRAHLAVILNESLNRCNRELPPVTPELLERAALLLGVDTSSEFALSTKAPRS